MANRPSHIPYARQHVDEDDIKAVSDVLRSDYLTTGPTVEKFEAKLAEICGAKYAISCSSGTAALHLSAMALNLGPDDKVIVPSITFLSTANAARYLGAEVIFADVDANTGLITPDTFEEAMDRNGNDITVAFPVHLAGQSPNMTELASLSQNRNITIVDDACHAIGASYSHDNNQSPVGSCQNSEMTVFSFHPVKTAAMGEGGAITTNNAEIDKKLRILRNIGLSRTSENFVNTKMAFDDQGDANPWYYEMSELGLNYRASDIHCALGLSQLKKLKKLVQKRRDIASKYNKLLEPLAPIIRPIGKMPDCNPAWHLYPVLINFDEIGMSRAELMGQLSDNGIGTQVHYIPVHHQPYYRQRYGDINLPGADAYYQSCLSLPLYYAMTDDDIERVVETLIFLTKQS